MLAVVTENARIYYRVAKELKKRGVHFYSLSPGEKIPSRIKVVITGKGERVDFPRVVFATPGRISLAVDRALQLLRGKKKYREIVISIDPGKSPGLAVLADNSVVYAACIREPEATSEQIKYLLGVFLPEEVKIKVGNGGGIYRDRILKNIKDNFSFPIYMVEENSTTPSLSSGVLSREARNIVAAINIALKDGKLFTGDIKLKPSRGEIKNIQRGSRELSGCITISEELAERVAKGELQLREAIEIYLRKEAKG